VNITARGMRQLEMLQCCDTTRNRLVRVAILVGREARSIRMTQLPAGSSAPRVKMAVVKHSDGVGFAAGHLFDFHLLEGDDQLGFWLVWASIFIFRH
jgi:hypothetical protein